MDAGTSRPNTLNLYQGPPRGMMLGVLLMENDFDNPNKYRDQVQQGSSTQSLGKVLTLACSTSQRSGPRLPS
ncbi:hypothetical protein SAMN06265337_4183 [Hymenobacter gelipurpurascens]|uniref:Uncharacterized protein n=1 Tax=Hymenobacter gelipurpurascens TaxID=89968 RepID=A0A212UHD7_9BACT|nr:hypothetical protein SAMN06265337_4183 [Hymenobacter gelipurpurascens]